MFLAHFGVGFAAKRFVPDINLAYLIGAAQLLDLIWPGLVLLGIERVTVAPGITVVNPLDFTHYPWSHSLLMALIWGILSGLTTYFLSRSTSGRLQNAVVIGALVPSHWVLDLLVHRPDLPFFPGGVEKAGLGGWNSLLLSLILEFGILSWGVWLYLSTASSLHSKAKYGLAALLVVLVGLWAGATFGPPPPSTTALAGSAYGMLLFLLWGGWIDRYRVSR
jgi:hypothetical protein